MAKLSHNVEYLGAWLGMKTAQVLSPRWADSFGAAVGGLAHRFLAMRRQVAFDNIKKGLGDSLTDREIQAIVRKVFQNIGRTVVEFARFKQIGLEGARRIIVGEGDSLFKKIQENGKGAVLVTGHFGNWELLGMWPPSLGYPVDFLVGTQHNLKVDRMLVAFRREMGVGIIPLKNSLRGILKALKARHFVCLVADQHDPSGGLIIDFLGRPASVPRGPAFFAVKTGCPVFPCMMRRERYDRHVVMPGEPIYPPDSGDEEADIRMVTEAYTRFFESCIRQYPDQWMWTHRRWKL
jgi:KDO2-lipid IV(A) lauroyltransferase